VLVLPVIGEALRVTPAGDGRPAVTRPTSRIPRRGCPAAACAPAGYVVVVKPPY